MNRKSLQQLIQDLYDKKIKPQEAYERLKNLPYEDLGFAQVDHHRSLRNGMPEVIYCEGKTPDQILTLIHKMDQAETDILATRLAPAVRTPFRDHFHVGDNFIELQSLSQLQPNRPVAAEIAGTG